MRSLYQSFLLLIARATDHELAKCLEFLRAENRVLRARLPARITVTPRERRTLLKYGKVLGSKVKELITIVTPRTFLRWLQEDGRPPKRRARKPGRPPTAESTRSLIVRLARENSWGYTRILGELKKLGVRKVARSTVVKILREEGLDPGPKRGEGSWDEFIKRHLATLYACDFFGAKVWTLGGLVDVFVLFVIHVGTRRVQITGISANPDRQWMIQQARNFAIHFGEQLVKPRFLVRDLDSKFVPEFDAILKQEGVEIVKVGPRKPNLNAFAERYVQSVKSECLSHFMIFGETHLWHLLASYLRHYHFERAHQGIGNVTPSGPPPPPESDVDPSEVECRASLGGLLKSYHRKAA